MYRSVRNCLAAEGATFSFEFFPPKTPEDKQQLWRAIRELEPLRPSFVSVTCGAGGWTRAYTALCRHRRRPTAATARCETLR